MTGAGAPDRSMRRNNMALPCHVQLEAHGLVGEDDGSMAWHKTALSLLVAGRRVTADVMCDAYSSRTTVRVDRDGIGMDAPTAQVLLTKVYDIAGAAMQWASCDAGEAFFDLENVIRQMFYRSAAKKLIRQIRFDACGGVLQSPTAGGIK
jgi:hypothetical protein